MTPTDSTRPGPSRPGIAVTVVGHIGILTINSPGTRNAINLDIARDLIEACRDLERDQTVGGIIIQGAGGYFCSGGDRQDLSAASKDPLSNENMARISTIYDSFVMFGSLGVPTVAAVRGGAVGAGLNLALAADVRVVSHTARLTPGFIPNGFHPGGGHMHLLHRAAGPDTAAALGMMGVAISGERAAQIGLAWSSHPDDQVEAAALALLDAIARDPDLARYAKHSYLAQTRTAGTSWATAVSIERVAQMWSFARAGRAMPSDE